MVDTTDRSPSATAIRRRAEEQLKSNAAATDLGSGNETARLLHELQVHQIELELQNAELHKSRDEFESLLKKYTDLYDFAPVGYFTLDRNGIISEVNLSGAHLFGVERSRLTGMRFSQFVTPADRSAFSLFREKVFTNRATKSCELTIATAAGNPRSVQIEALIAPSEHECRVILVDITELQRTRQDLQKSQKLESLGFLAGGLAHDFNNVLTAVLGNISLARNLSNSPEELAERLEQAEQAALRARDLTQQLLTFAQGGAPVKNVITLDSLLEETVALTLHDSAVTCQFTLAPDLWPVHADEGQLRQVIRNLVTNALQAMGDGGTLTITARNIHVPPDEWLVEISVADSGTGIPKHLLPRIFDPFFTTKAQGNGLGLATSYSIIKKHDGTIAVESVPGKGTIVHISLPAAQHREQSAAATPPVLQRGEGRILVMDDEEIVREMLTVMLTGLGYLVECTADGNAAVDLYGQRLAEGTPFDAVIMDLTVPGGVGGKDAIASLLRIDPQVKAVVSSGYSTDAVMANYRDYGFSAVLGKPYLPQEMCRVLHELLAAS